MEGLVVLLVCLVLWILIGPIIAMVNAGSAKHKAESAEREVAELRAKLFLLERELAKRPSSSEVEMEGSAASMAQHPGVLPGTRSVVVPPPLRVPKPAAPSAREWPESNQVVMEVPDPAVVESAVADETVPVVATSVAVDEPKEVFSWERFMGVKLFAWLGGIAMFFGVIFFVKYAFEKNLIPPHVRVALGFLTGAGFLLGGLMTHRLPKYRVLAQVFCATGVVILYGVTFAAHAIYRFQAFGTVPTMVLMALITMAAFLIAVRLDALVVAVLGMLGGFVTPLLVATGRDEVWGLFGYVALLDIGLLAVAVHGRWRFLAAAAAAGTAITQVAWCSEYFIRGRYFEGNLILTPMAILLGFVVIFMAGWWLGRKRVGVGYFAEGAVLGVAATGWVFAFAMLGFSQVANRYPLLYGFILLVEVAVIAVSLMRPKLALARVVATLLVFLHLALWSGCYLTVGNLTGVLVVYLVVGAINAVVPVVLARRGFALPFEWLDLGPWCGPLTVLMMLVPLCRFVVVPMMIWPAILVVDLLVIALAVLTGRIIPVLVSLVLTMGMAAMWLLKVPCEVGHLMPILGVISGFSLVFMLAGKWLGRRGSFVDGFTITGMPPALLLPVCSGVLPFALLVLALQRLPVANPTPVFGVALLMSVLLCGMSVLARQGPLVLTSLVGTLATEGVWHANHFQSASPVTALGWYLGFYGLFMAFPFVFRRACRGQTAPWIASALSGVGHFLLVHDLVRHAYPNSMMGLIPAAFAVPALIALVVVVRMAGAMDESNRSQLAWFGGVALLFITLIFPIQFSRQWITVSWALEGALLLWLYRRVPHRGLQMTGLALLGVCFARLALNPVVFTDYARSGTAVLNWHFYAYGVVAVSLFAGAWWYQDGDGRFVGAPIKGIMNGFGAILLFLLFNIEIADYFTNPGDRCVAFVFGGNFARDMTYSIAWGMFSLGLLAIGIWLKSAHARYAAIGLLVVTVLKVLVHDMAASQTVFRVGALLGVAVIAFVASFLYQRFFDRTKSL